jgi:hypothetical protein
MTGVSTAAAAWMDPAVREVWRRKSGPFYQFQLHTWLHDDYIFHRESAQ